MSMTAVPASMPASTSSAKPSHLDAKVADDLDALWRSVFERAHAGETHAEPAAKAAVPHAPSHDDGGRRETRRAPQVQTPPFDPSPDAPQFAERRTSNVAAAAPTVRSMALATNATESSVRVSAVAEPQTPAAMSALPMVREEIGSKPPTVERAPPRHEAAPVAVERAWTDETVSVFMSGGTVTVNVRDAGLTDDEALRCAFETARTLTGERASLRALLLNGRAVYRQAPQPEAAVSPTLVFAC